MSAFRRIAAYLVAPFQFRGRIHVTLLAIFVALNALVLVNTVLHDPRIGYDQQHHLNYAWTLAEGRLPTRADSWVFYSPPLPYVVPAVAYAVTHDAMLAAKIAQFVNAIVSVILTFFLLKTCRLLSQKPALGTGALLFLGILPVYYKTFSFVRGEPYVACFAVIVTYYTLLILVRKQFTVRNALLLGMVLGLGAMSRQWGILLYPAVALAAVRVWVIQPRWRGPVARCLCLSLLVGSLLGGWYYAVLKIREGAATAFNMTRASTFSLTNHPAAFYYKWSPGLLFSKPVRPAFENQFWPEFYSEIWGDYRLYFAVYGMDTQRHVFVCGEWLREGIKKKFDSLETNYESMGVYLGRVNRVSIFPSVLALAALTMAVVGVVRPSREPLLTRRRKEAMVFILLAIATTMGGYAWFLIMHQGSARAWLSIRATHVLQAFPMVALLVGILLERIEQRSRVAYALAVAGLVLVCAHNLPVMVTHYATYRLK